MAVPFPESGSLVRLTGGWHNPDGVREGYLVWATDLNPEMVKADRWNQRPWAVVYSLPYDVFLEHWAKIRACPATYEGWYTASSLLWDMPHSYFVQDEVFHYKLEVLGRSGSADRQEASRQATQNEGTSMTTQRLYPDWTPLVQVMGTKSRRTGFYFWLPDVNEAAAETVWDDSEAMHLVVYGDRAAAEEKLQVIRDCEDYDDCIYQFGKYVSEYAVRPWGRWKEESLRIAWVVAGSRIGKKRRGKRHRTRIERTPATHDLWSW